VLPLAGGALFPFCDVWIEEVAGCVIGYGGDRGDLMKKLMVCVVALAAMFGASVRAQDVAGDWQGTLKITGGQIRMVVKVSKEEKGVWAAKLYNADRATPPMNASSVTVDGSTFKFSADPMGAKYQGKLSADGKTIVGTWTMGGLDTPVTLARATPETAWELPAQPEAPKPMAADADPGFEVATIKPNMSGEANLRQLTMNGRNFVLQNGSLDDLIGFAYNVQKNQIVSGPDWADKDRFDIGGVPDVEGAPSVEQLRLMIRKLLADRYKLAFHHEKREMSAYVLTAEKGGQKLVASGSRNSLPNIGMRGTPNGLRMTLANARVVDFTSLLQMIVLDKPVVDQTGIDGRYDLTVTFTPNGSEFNGHPPRGGAAAESADAAPNLYEAIQQQLGLKLSAEKAQVDVIVIDHVDKPSPN
jgi:uncharacterized protein (TIGR03435 family)